MARAGCATTALAAGVEEADSGAARELAEEQAAHAALRFARRRIGPFAEAAPDAEAREKALAAMVRADTASSLPGSLVDCPPGEEPDPDDLRYSR